jgi:hypothetical protein
MKAEFFTLHPEHNTYSIMTFTIKIILIVGKRPDKTDRRVRLDE